VINLGDPTATELDVSLKILPMLIPLLVAGLSTAGLSALMMENLFPFVPAQTDSLGMIAQ
jgi:hypothetical protein